MSMLYVAEVVLMTTAYVWVSLVVLMTTFCLSGDECDALDASVCSRSGIVLSVLQCRWCESRNDEKKNDTWGQANVGGGGSEKSFAEAVYQWSQRAQWASDVRLIQGA